MLLCAADQLKNMQVSIDQMKQISDKAKSTWDKFRKERDFHKMHHNIAVFLEVGHWLAGRFHHLETLIGDASGPCLAPQSKLVAVSRPARDHGTLLSS